MKYYSVNGTIVPSNEAVLQPTDLSIIAGYAIFDFFLIKEGHPLFFEDHLDRFERSARHLHLKIPYSRATLSKKILELVAKNGIKNASIRLLLTGGYSMVGYHPTDPNLVIMQHPYPTYASSYYEKGAKVVCKNYIRELPLIKTTNYAMGILELNRIKQEQAVGVLYHDGERILELERANFFMVQKDKTIVTPKENILPGITRQRLLSFAQKKFKIEVRDLRLEELQTASEAFVTSSSKRIMPIVQVENLQISHGVPGPVTRALIQALVEEEASYINGVK